MLSFDEDIGKYNALNCIKCLKICLIDKLHAIGFRTKESQDEKNSKVVLLKDTEALVCGRDRKF